MDLLKRLTILFAFLLYFTSPAPGQSLNEQVDRLESLMRNPPEAQPVHCNEEKYAFDRVKLDGTRLLLRKTVNLDESRTVFRYEIPLEKLSLSRFDIRDRECYTELILYASAENRVFDYEMVKYIGDNISELDRNRESRLRLEVFRDQQRKILNALFAVARNVQNIK